MYTEDTTRGLDLPTTEPETQGLSTLSFSLQQKIEACKTLYVAYQGRHHEAIEREMRRLGYKDFTRRILYTRNQRGQRTPGWPERFGSNAQRDEGRGMSDERRSSADNADSGLETARPVLKPSTDKTRSDRLLSASSAANSHYGHSSGNGSSDSSLIPHPSSFPESAPNSRYEHSSGNGSSDSSLIPHPSSFAVWLARTFPYRQWHHKHIEYVCDILEKFTKGEIKRLMIFMPPRHGKSELVTTKYAAWRLLQDPKLRIIIGSHKQDLASEFSAGIKNALAEHAAVSEQEAAATRQDTAVSPTPKRKRTPHDPETCEFCISHPGPEDCPTLANYLAAETVIAKLSALLTSQTTQTSSTSQTYMKARRINRGSQWQTPEGGGVRAVGVGGGIAGFGGDLLIIDDPIKSREVAESQGFRNKLWKWFTDDLSTRKQPGAGMILIQTRWHEDDLAGRLLRDMRENPKAEQWTIIDLPALAEPPATDNGKRKTENGECQSTARPFLEDDYEPEPPPKKRSYYWYKGALRPIYAPGEWLGEGEDPAKSRSTKETSSTAPQTVAADDADRKRSDRVLSASSASPPLPISSSPLPPDTWRDVLGRKYGEALCPDWFSVADLEEARRMMGTYSFLSMYQQRPVPAEGAIFKKNWFRKVDRAPASTVWKRGYDLGLSNMPGADYTATAKIGFDHDGNMYIDGVIRRRMEYPEQRRMILGLLLAEPNIDHIIEESANGHAVLQDLRAELRGRGTRLRGLRVKENKVARTFGWSALAEDGHVFVVEGDWNDEFIEEVCAFPNSPHDDQIDAVSLAVKMFQERGRRTTFGF